MATIGKEERERAALAARAAARAQLAAAGQVLPTPALPGAAAAPGAPLGLTEQTRSLLAARNATDAAASAASAREGASGSAASAGWAQAPQGFFFHEKGGLVQWADPRAAPSTAPLPQGWFVGEGAGKPYYYTALFTNARGVEGQLCTWERPAAPPNFSNLTAGM